LREQQFISENEPAWKRVEAHLVGNTKMNAGELANAYISITEDLAFARSTYAGSSLIEYLNNLAARFHNSIYRHQEKPQPFSRFWTIDLPLVMHGAFPALRLSLLIFLISIAIGGFSCWQNPAFVRQILSDEYVDVTEENIRKGDPLAIYKSESQTNMFLGIGINNVRVALLAFAVGLLSSFVTAFILISNGIMVGCFLYYFVSKGLGWIAFSTIFLHGALELSCIVISGAAGIIIGNSWLFPGTYPRITALIMQARKGLSIMLGITPVIVVAALLESFLTRHYQSLYDVSRIFVIIISFAFIIGYFVIYPKMVANQLKEKV
jgi:uncharacterized membrane protein SpoIIM required for sporulation